MSGLQPIRKFQGTGVPIPITNIDTDQITPARFLKKTDKEGLGNVLFYDWRFDESGNPKVDFPLNKPQYKGASILIGGDNFGCGSSREMAPWAVLAYGFKAVVSTSIADIFRNNSLKNGLVPIVVEADAHKDLMELVTKNPQAIITVDVEKQTISWGTGRWAKFPIDAFAKRCLLQGVDQLGYLLSKDAQIAEYERAHPPRMSTQQK
jgi:3-isopropylmalate/(R)-2-methylmalate dehydratase small subunit